MMKEVFIIIFGCVDFNLKLVVLLKDKKWTVMMLAGTHIVRMQTSFATLRRGLCN